MGSEWWTFVLGASPQWQSHTSTALSTTGGGQYDTCKSQLQCPSSVPTPVSTPSFSSTCFYSRIGATKYWMQCTCINRNLLWRIISKYSPGRYRGLRQHTTSCGYSYGAWIQESLMHLIGIMERIRSLLALSDGHLLFLCSRISCPSLKDQWLAAFHRLSHSNWMSNMRSLCLCLHTWRIRSLGTWL